MYEATAAMMCKFLYLRNTISKPTFAVEDYYLAIIGDGSELILLICDVLYGDYSVLGNERIIIPECLSVG